MTKTCILLLALIDEKPCNAYELLKRLKILDIPKWYPIAKQTLYTSVNKLCEKGFIIGEVCKNGNFPEKTIYTLTQVGKEEVKKGIKAFLENTEIDMVAFNLGIMFLNHLDKEEVLIILNTKWKKMTYGVAYMEKNIEALRENGNVPYSGIIPLKHSLNVMKSELSCIAELIEAIKKDNEWNHFISHDLIIPK